MKQMANSHKSPNQVTLCSEQEIEAIVGTTKLDHGRRTVAWSVLSFDFSCDIHMVASKLGFNDIKAWIHSAPRLGVMVGDIFLANLGPLGSN